MGKTFRRNDFRRPKKDRSGQKSRRQREYEDDKFKSERFNYRPHLPSPESLPPNTFPELTDT